MRPSPRAFTVVEVLVAIAAVALLLGLLVPAVSGARESAREASCGVMQRQLHLAAMQHAFDNRSEIPGVNTTGRRFLGAPASVVRQMLGDSSPDMPTSVFDWVSPSIGPSANLSPNRARRTKQIFEDLGCPSASGTNTTLYGPAPDKATDFLPLLEREGIGQISYLSPGAFHLLGPSPYAALDGRRYGWRGPAIPPEKYKPRLERLGAQPSSKVFLADGTRYVNRKGELDFDVDPTPRYYGSFTTSGPIYEGSTAYGRQPHRPEFSGERHESRTTYPLNKRLSYRHRGRINVFYFDGHLGSMDEAASKTDAAPWYPGGSVFTGVRATEESRAHHMEGEILP